MRQVVNSADAGSQEIAESSPCPQTPNPQAGSSRPRGITFPISGKVAILLSGVAGIVLLVAVFGPGLFWPAEGELEVIYPIDGSIFPPDFVAPTFLWRDNDSGANHWSIEITANQSGESLRYDCQGNPPPPGEIDKRCISENNEIYVPPAEDGLVHSWTPDARTWKEIQQQCGRFGATVTITGFRKDQRRKVLSRDQITISISKDPVGAAIFYRDVPLMPSEDKLGAIHILAKQSLPLIGWRLRDVSKPRSRLVMEDMPSCANCHTFSSDGKTLGMDIDGRTGDKGAYALAPIREKMVIENEDLITWNSFPDKLEGHKTIGFMSQISPDGQYVVTTVNESIYITIFKNYKFLQVFFPTRGILAYYSRRTGQMKSIPGADDPAYVHCNPAWSPDGKYLVFARAKAMDPNPVGHAKAKYANDPNEIQIQYDLYRIPFNDGQGGRPEPIPGASQNGMSNTFPKISPDGRWIVLVKCRNGQLMRPDSRLWIVPTTGGQAREMQCNTSLVNSWHSFSPNGRWMVFSSKSNTPYTQMFLTHIDEQGRDSPAILIPNSTAANRAVNLPEFVNITDDKLLHIDVPAIDWRRPFNRGRNLLGNGENVLALEQFKESLLIDPEQARTHLLLGLAFNRLQLNNKAVTHWRRGLQIDPDNVQGHTALGTLLALQGKYEEAIEHFHQVLRIMPDDANARGNLSTALDSQAVAYAKAGRFDEAIKAASKAVDAATAAGKEKLATKIRKRVALYRQGIPPP
jgi:Tol biopolymer transport system component